MFGIEQRGVWPNTSLLTSKHLSALELKFHRIILLSDTMIDGLYIDRGVNSIHLSAGWGSLRKLAAKTAQ